MSGASTPEPDPDKTERQKGPQFSAYVLLSEPVQFTSGEIEAAVLEDYPSLDLDPATGLGMNMACDTAEFITAPVFLGAGGADGGGIATLIRLPGYGTWDPAQITDRQRIGCIDIADRLQRNASYICVSVGATGPGLTEAFRAARLCSCIASVFARLPVALACYWESADHFLSPDRVVAMADKSVGDDWPVNDWIGLHIDPRGRDDRGRDWTAAATGGLALFRGYDLSLPVAPLAPGDAGALLYATAATTLAYGNEFKDGDTIGMEDGDPGAKYRFRLLPEGAQGAQTDMLIMIHPESPFDEEAALGPHIPNPAPPGVDNVRRARPGFFKRLIRGAAEH